MSAQLGREWTLSVRSWGRVAWGYSMDVEGLLGLCRSPHPRPQRLRRCRSFSLPELLGALLSAGHLEPSAAEHLNRGWC